MMFAALNQAMTVLLLTEGDRRRVRIELQDEDSEDDASGLIQQMIGAMLERALETARRCVGMRLAPGLMPAVPESGRPPMGAGRAANVSKRVCRLVRSANPAAGRTVDRLVTVGEAGWRCHC